ncbi:MAG: outer membrane beta-barrel protein [Cytophagaceae bacterium]|nr:outer membrane beta-barrel protein [Cytophagaceae bacterium]
MISSKIRLIWGYKGIFRSIRSDFLFADKIADTYVPNLAATNIFDFNEQVHAFVRSFAFKKKTIAVEL